MSTASEGESSAFLQYPVFSGRGQLLTLKEDIIRRWKEYFPDLLNLAETPSMVDEEMECSEPDSFIAQGEGTLLLKKLHGGKTSGVDANSPEYLRALDVVRITWLTPSLQNYVEVRDSTPALADWRGGSPA